MTKLHRYSQHFDERPADSVIKLIVIHNISLPAQFFDGPWIDDFFLGRLSAESHPFFKTIAELRVSSHLLIRRDGQIIQYVPFSKRAWHAGESNWQGESDCNNFSIGIELEGSDTQAFSDAQYTSLQNEVLDLLKTYRTLDKKSICGHSEIAPMRKTDPGPNFDWQRFYLSLENEMKP